MSETSSKQSDMSKSTAPSRPQRVMQDGRIVFYRRSPDAGFWDDYWKTKCSEKVYQSAQRGKLGLCRKAVKKWLPRDGKILEAGCGPGQIVLALRVRGWDAEGVEWAPETVRFAKTHVPSLPIREGDVTKLDVPDGYYNGYVSLGVVEHRQAGPQPFLDEAYRVLKPGGIALISVPYINPIRAWKAKQGAYRDEIGDLDFYQYAFARPEFTGIIRSAGFEVQDVSTYDGFHGIKTEVDDMKVVGSLVNAGLRVRPLRSLIARTLKYSRYGHMMLVVGRKPMGPKRE